MMFLQQKGLRSKEKVLNKDAKGLNSAFGPKVPVFCQIHLADFWGAPVPFTEKISLTVFDPLPKVYAGFSF